MNTIAKTEWVSVESLKNATLEEKDIQIKQWAQQLEDVTNWLKARPCLQTNGASALEHLEQIVGEMRE